MTTRLSDAPYYAISSLAQLLCNVISLVNDEVLVEDLEDLAALKVSHLVWVYLVSGRLLLKRRLRRPIARLGARMR